MALGPQTRAGLTKFRPVRPGSRVALVAPASGFDREEFDRGVAELKRIGQFEEFGVNNLSEFPDNGPTVHPSPSNKGGNTIDWEIEQDALLGAGTGSDPIDSWSRNPVR